MGQFSVTIYGATGSVLSDIQHPYIEERLKLDIQTDVRNPIGREEHPDDWWELIDTKRK